MLRLAYRISQQIIHAACLVYAMDMVELLLLFFGGRKEEKGDEQN